MTGSGSATGPGAPARRGHHGATAAAPHPAAPCTPNLGKETAAPRLWIRNPRVLAAAGAATSTLRADISSKSLSGGGVVEYPNVDVAELDLTGGTRAATDDGVTGTAIPAKLTAAGFEAFGGFYPAGGELDPVSFAVGAQPKIRRASASASISASISSRVVCTA